MKYIVAIFSTCILLSCTNQNTSNGQEGTSPMTAQLSECDQEKVQARKDFDEGKYTITVFGMLADFEFFEFYNTYMMDNYNIRMDNPGCEVVESVECYSAEMEKLLTEKFGEDFFAKTSDEAQAIFDKTKNPLREETIIGGQIVEKEFYKKNGKPAGFTELYLRASIQDYFIKLCESKVTKEELEKYIDQGITVKVELIEGNWDICPDDTNEMQSRIGMYATILEIID